MSVWYAKIAIIIGTLIMLAIRAPRGQRSKSIKIITNRRGRLETTLLTIAWIGYFIPLIWIVSPALAFAEYTLHLAPLVIGCVFLAAGLWMFHRSHADLGRNWSITLQVREDHRLITHGVYRRIRHPMYFAMLLYSVGQALVIPNWVAGFAHLAAFLILFSFRVGNEEKLMREEFGHDYVAYMARTKRLLPGVW